MPPSSVFAMLEENVSKPRFYKSLSFGETWKSNSMVTRGASGSVVAPPLLPSHQAGIIPEEFLRSASGAIEHRVVFSVSWGNSWQLWLQRDKNGMSLWMTTCEVQTMSCSSHTKTQCSLKCESINKICTYSKKSSRCLFLKLSLNLKSLTLIPRLLTRKLLPLALLPLLLPLHLLLQVELHRVLAPVPNVQNPEQYLFNPNNPYFVKTLTKKIDVLYVRHPVIEKYGLNFGPHKSPMYYITLP
ncbi:hypothetical protein DY000_02026045 [Brassica cretica]|uniref:Uncharacterized protein n=1 Tax=Brassica cretica TaxID=69181 RepID=A0ABQ7EKV4_BRACR|nr:hypothetical protein DY000_02026045 [Brassica cretica]